MLLACFVIGVGGMIAGSVDDNNGVAITFGLLSAVAALCLLVLTAVVPPRLLASRPTAEVDEQSAADLEERIAALVEAGADEHEVRVLVRRAVDAGRRSGAPVTGD